MILTLKFTPTWPRLGAGLLRWRGLLSEGKGTPAHMCAHCTTPTLTHAYTTPPPHVHTHNGPRHYQLRHLPPGLTTGTTEDQIGNQPQPETRPSRSCYKPGSRAASGAGRAGLAHGGGAPPQHRPCEPPLAPAWSLTPGTHSRLQPLQGDKTAWLPLQGTASGWPAAFPKRPPFPRGTSGPAWSCKRPEKSQTPSRQKLRSPEPASGRHDMWEGEGGGGTGTPGPCDGSGMEG